MSFLCISRDILAYKRRINQKKIILVFMTQTVFLYLWINITKKKNNTKIMWIKEERKVRKNNNLKRTKWMKRFSLHFFQLITILCKHKMKSWNKKWKWRCEDDGYGCGKIRVAACGWYCARSRGGHET